MVVRDGLLPRPFGISCQNLHPHDQEMFWRFPFPSLLSSPINPTPLKSFRVPFTSRARLIRRSPTALPFAFYFIANVIQLFLTGQQQMATLSLCRLNLFFPAIPPKKPILSTLREFSIEILKSFLRHGNAYPSKKELLSLGNLFP